MGEYCLEVIGDNHSGEALLETKRWDSKRRQSHTSGSDSDITICNDMIIPCLNCPAYT